MFFAFRLIAKFENLSYKPVYQKLLLKETCKFYKFNEGIKLTIAYQKNNKMTSLINYRPSNSEDGVGYLSDIFTFYQIDSLEKINIGYAIFYTGFLESENYSAHFINTSKYL